MEHQLKHFLRQHRSAIPPETRTLGSHERLPRRLGRPVTQEELAEAVGISRVWYCLLESGRDISVSTRLLDRLARALMLPPESRAALFHLAVPELSDGHFVR